MKVVVIIFLLLLSGCFAGHKTPRIIVMPGVPEYECAKIWAEASIEKKNGRLSSALALYYRLIECDENLSSKLYPYTYYDIITCHLGLLHPDSALVIRRKAQEMGYGDIVRSLDSILPPTIYKYVAALDQYIPYAPPPNFKDYNYYDNDSGPLVRIVGNIDSVFVYPYETDSLSLQGRVWLRVYLDERLSPIYTELIELEGSYLFAAAANYTATNSGWTRLNLPYRSLFGSIPSDTSTVLGVRKNIHFTYWKK